jgi:hypothetical protein
MNISLLQQNMWTTMCEESGLSVDKGWLSTAPKTTQLQDVLSGLEVCEVVTVGVIGKRALYPQSTGLITVIRSSYKHALLTINNVTQRSRP